MRERSDESACWSKTTPSWPLTLATGLRREGMAVDVVFDGHDALAHAAATSYDVVVLDRDIPGVHGDEVCRRLVAERQRESASSC